MHVLAIEPYYGGSHQAFWDGLALASRHRWTLATLPARHWKWRMRSAPVAIQDVVADAVATHGRPDLILASEMLDLPTWLGFASRDDRFKQWLSDVPLITYFHENQWAYPTAPEARIDHHFGYTNLLTAAASDACWFNSEFNRRTFLELSHSFIDRMPDSRHAIDLGQIEASSRVVAPGFQVPDRVPRDRDNDAPLRLGWVGRFEHDKRPDRFAELLNRLANSNVRFELILLGQRGRNSKALDEIRDLYGDTILFDGYAESRDEYEYQLGQIDVVISTADHEFFGIAICEAIWAGAVPLTPNGLSYVEFVPGELRYDSIDQAAQMVADLSRRKDRSNLNETSRSRIAGYRISVVASDIDAELERVAS